MVVDSHVLLWWLEGSPLLSDRALRLFTEVGQGPGLEVCGVTFWELRMKEIRGRLEPKTPISEWPVLLGRLEGVTLVETRPSMWLRAAELEWEHRDPADRMIAATAVALGVPVLTKDRKFHEEGCPVEAVW